MQGSTLANCSQCIVQEKLGRGEHSGDWAASWRSRSKKILASLESKLCFVLGIAEAFRGRFSLIVFCDAIVAGGARNRLTGFSRYTCNFMLSLPLRLLNEYLWRGYSVERCEAIEKQVFVQTQRRSETWSEVLADNVFFGSGALYTPRSPFTCEFCYRSPPYLCISCYLSFAHV